MKNLSRRSFLKVAGLGIIGLSLVGATSRSPLLPHAQVTPIRIGHQAPLTGAFAAFGKWHNRALQAAIKRFNDEGGVGGRSLALITEDATSDAGTAKGIFSKLVLQDGVDFVIGSVDSTSNVASAPLAQQLKTPYFPMGVATQITGSAGNRWIFKSYHTDRAALQSAGQWALQNLGKRWTIIASEITFAQSQAQDWTAQVQQFGGLVLRTITVPFRAPDFLPFLNQIDLDQTEALFQAFTAVDTIRFFSQAAQLGITSRLKTLGLIEGVDTLGTAAPGFEGASFVTSYPRRADQVPQELQAFDEIYRQAVGISPEDFSLDNPKEVVPISDLFGSWQALSLIREAITRSHWQTAADHPQFIQALEGFQYAASGDFPQGTGFIRAEDHQAFHDHYLEQVQAGKLTVVLHLPQATGFYPPTVNYPQQGF
jgi:branched-chain amino acid transport system substrate-binding protein